MKRSIISAFSIAVALTLASPQSALSQNKQKRNVQHYVVTEMTGSFFPVDSLYDVGKGRDALAVLLPYKNKVNGLMNAQIGVSAKNMLAGNPEGLLSNLIADVLRIGGSKVLGGKTCDVALMNIGGIRSTLPKGKITVANIFEILPFENTLAVATMTGVQLLELMKEIAQNGGGISGAKIVVDQTTRQLLNATVGGLSIDAGKTYSVATINYLAEGNDGFKVFAEPSVRKIIKEDLLARDVLMDYVKEQTKRGKKIDAEMENRFVYR